MPQPFMNFYRKQGEDGSVDFKDRSPENTIAVWKNKSKGGKYYYNMKTPDGEKWIGFPNRFYQEEDEEESEW